MKKIKVLLCVFAVVSMLFTCAFASGEDINISVVFDGEYATVSMDAASDFTLMGFSSFWMSYDNTVWEFDSVISSYADFTVADAGTYIDMGYASMNNLEANNTTNFVKLKFKLKSEKVAYGTTFGTHTNGMLNGSTYAYLTVGSATIARPVAAEANTTVAGYTDVVNFNSSLSDVTATNPTLTFDLYEDGEFHKSYTESLGNGITLENGTLNFKIAVYGAPTGKTITLQNPAVK